MIKTFDLTYRRCVELSQDLTSLLWAQLHHAWWAQLHHAQAFAHVEEYVAILGVGSQPKQGLAKVWTKNETQESHSMLPGVWESVKEWTFTFSSELPNFYKAIARVETHWIETFLIS
jgi:hypothetical protein